jgi:hypothetical protein
MWLETEIEEYNDYLENIRLLISKESSTKFEKIIEPDKINIKDISKTRALDDYFDTDKARWVFYYEFSIEKTKTSGMSKQISFNEWKRLKLVDDRDEKLKQIGL